MLLKIIYLFSRLNLPFTICQAINKARSLTVDLAGKLYGNQARLTALLITTFIVTNQF